MERSDINGTSFYCENSLHIKCYDILYSRAAEQYKDIEFYEKLAADSRKCILDAACGTGRIFTMLTTEHRSITAFDVSDELLNIARKRASSLSNGKDVYIQQSYLETFDFEQEFDLIIVGYYGFSYLLTEDKQIACLKAIKRHLAPNGIAVLHLPDPSLLSRHVPQHEIDAMKSKIRLQEQGKQFVIDFRVLSMRYDAENRVRTMVTELAILDEPGNTLISESKEMHYAYIEQEKIRELAQTAGLKVDTMYEGFYPGAVGELVVMLS